MGTIPIGFKDVRLATIPPTNLRSDHAAPPTRWTSPCSSPQFVPIRRRLPIDRDHARSKAPSCLAIGLGYEPSRSLTSFTQSTADGAVYYTYDAEPTDGEYYARRPHTSWNIQYDANGNRTEATEVTLPAPRSGRIPTRAEVHRHGRFDNPGNPQPDRDDGTHGLEYDAMGTAPSTHLANGRRPRSTSGTSATV